MLDKLSQKKKIAITIVALLVVGIICYFLFFRKKGGGVAKIIADNTAKDEVKTVKTEPKPQVRPQVTDLDAKSKLVKVPELNSTQETKPIAQNGQQKKAESIEEILQKI